MELIFDWLKWFLVWSIFSIAVIVYLESRRS